MVCLHFVLHFFHGRYVLCETHNHVFPYFMFILYLHLGIHSFGSQKLLIFSSFYSRTFVLHAYFFLPVAEFHLHFFVGLAYLKVQERTKEEARETFYDNIVFLCFYAS